MRVPSDFALELLVSIVGLNISTISSAATSAEISIALDIKSIDGFVAWLRELIEDDLIRKQAPQSIREDVKYYVNMERYNQLLKQLNADNAVVRPVLSTDWAGIALDIRGLKRLLDASQLSQSERSQAAAIVVSLEALVEAPNPPKNVIRNLLYDLAAIATLFSFAFQVAEKIN